MKNLGKLRELALRYAQLRTGGNQKQPLPVRAVPQLPPGLTQGPQPTMRFVPGVQLDPSQVEDRRTGRIGPGGYRTIEGLPMEAGGRAGPGGDRFEQYDEGFNALEQVARRYGAMRAARNRTSTGVGVNKNGKQRRRN